MQKLAEKSRWRNLDGSKAENLLRSGEKFVNSIEQAESLLLGEACAAEFTEWALRIE